MRLSVDDLLVLARRNLRRVTPAAAADALAECQAMLVDVRTSDQRHADGDIPGAVPIALNVLEWRLDPDSRSRLADGPDLDDLVIVICDEGYSSSLAAARLQDLGFARATDVIGGFQAWRGCGLAVKVPSRTL